MSFKRYRVIYNFDHSAIVSPVREWRENAYANWTTPPPEFVRTNVDAATLSFLFFLLGPLEGLLTLLQWDKTRGCNPISTSANMQVSGPLRIDEPGGSLLGLSLAENHLHGYFPPSKHHPTCIPCFCLTLWIRFA